MAKHYWVGENRLFSMYVYDEEIQHRVQGKVLLYSNSNDKLIAFEKNFAKSQLRTVTDADRKREALSKYLTWKNNNYASWSSSTDKQSPTTIRRPYCFSCKEALSSLTSKKCQVCNWLICPNCGSCSFECDS